MANDIVALLREDHPAYRDLGRVAIVERRGRLLLALAESKLPDDALPLVLEELESGLEPALVAIAARVLRQSSPRPEFAAFLLRAIENIRGRDDSVDLNEFGIHGVQTTSLGEIICSLDWLGPRLAASRAELLKALELPGLAADHRDALERLAQMERDCCDLFWLFSRWRKKQAFQDHSSRPGHAEFPIRFEDHDGNAVDFNSFFHGQPAIVIFFFTRCDNPNKCSLSVSKLARIQKLLQERGLADRIRTAAITYDHDYDQPQRLRNYGLARGLQLNDNHRMLRATDGVEEMMQQFQLGVNYVMSVVNRHQVEAYVLDREGRIAARFERLLWDESAVMDRAIEELPRRTRLAAPTLGTAAAIGVAFFPKCPVCWAAYLSVFGIAGLDQLPYAPWLKPLLITAMGINILSVGLRGYATRRIAPFMLVIAGAIAILFGESMIGVVCTLIGSLLSALRK